jgi:8-oxo-dGTP diphosphatase
MLQPDAHLEIPSPYYRVSLKALIFDDQQRILVVQDQDDTWEVPGGGWEHGEDMQQCLNRELMEELCVGVEQVDLATTYIYSSKGRTGHWRLKLAIPTTINSYKFKPSANVKAWRFVTAEQLADLEMIDSEAGIKNYIAKIWPDNLTRS